MPSAQIHAFEPVPERIEQLHAHVQHNGASGIVINPCAVGAGNGSFSFFAVHQGNTGASSLVRRAASDLEIRVPVVTLDAYTARKEIDRVDVIKIDVEGAELLVLSGGTKLLSGDDAPAIFFEADDKLSASFGVSIRQTKELLTGHGYGIYRWHGTNFTAVTIEEPHGHEDLFALKPRHVAQMRIP
jgi:FkbM family methyltransferase